MKKAEQRKTLDTNLLVKKVKTDSMSVEKASKIYLISAEIIKKESNSLDTNIDNDTIRNGVRFVQDYVIEHVIGTSLCNKLKCLIDQEVINQKNYTSYWELLTVYLKPIFIHGVAAEIMIPNAYKTRNLGTFQINGDNKVASTLKEIQYIQQEEKNHMDYYVNRAIKYLVCNMQCYPELCGCTCSWYQAQFASKMPSIGLNLHTEEDSYTKRMLSKGYHPFTNLRD